MPINSNKKHRNHRVMNFFMDLTIFWDVQGRDTADSVDARFKHVSTSWAEIVATHVELKSNCTFIAS